MTRGMIQTAMALAASVWLSGVANREEVIFEGADPVREDSITLRSDK
jgi:hypothetical protein